MTTQTEAERLADALQAEFPGYEVGDVAAAELRRLVSFNQQLMDEVARLQKREWVGLTNAEIRDIHWSKPMNEYVFARAIEAKLKEKNT